MNLIFGASCFSPLAKSDSPSKKASSENTTAEAKPDENLRQESPPENCPIFFPRANLCAEVKPANPAETFIPRGQKTKIRINFFVPNGTIYTTNGLEPEVQITSCCPGRPKGTLRLVKNEAGAVLYGNYEYGPIILKDKETLTVHINLMEGDHPKCGATYELPKP